MQGSVVRGQGTALDGFYLAKQQGSLSIIETLVGLDRLGVLGRRPDTAIPQPLIRANVTLVVSLMLERHFRSVSSLYICHPKSNDPRENIDYILVRCIRERNGQVLRGWATDKNTSEHGEDGKFDDFRVIEPRSSSVL